MKILRSRKALSPVVASIILIAVTVAVSIAVAAWMGALTFNFMATEEVKITNVAFVGSGATVNVTMLNTGTTSVTLSEIWIGSNKTLVTDLIPANGNLTKPIAFTWINGYNYQIKVMTMKGNQYYYNAIAPSQ
jgi:flagellin-like protein